jgi:endoglucanase
MPVTAAAQPASGLQLLGVNLSGAEDGNPVTGVMNYDYIYPTTSEIDYFASLGLNTIRIPVAWQRLQPTEDGPLSTTQLSQLETLVAYAQTKGVSVDIDLHNYGAGWGSDVGTAATPDSAFANFWSQMAEVFKNSPNVIFGLMNEPNSQTPAAWAVAAQDAVSAIRASGATQEILVSGSDWDTASSWVSSGNAATVGEITDPLNKIVFEVHQYFDAGSTGTTTQVLSPDIGPESLAAVTQWAEENGKKLFLGEFGAGRDSASLTAEGNTLNYLNANADVWQGATYWAGGPWMGNYMFSADPQNGVEAPQTAVLAAAATSTIGMAQAAPSAPESDTILLNLSEDAWEGNAEFTVKVNGQQIGGDDTAYASHSSGDAGTVSLTGDWGSGVNDVQVSFINDAYGGSADEDRNLYVNSISENGVTYAGTSAAIDSNGSRIFAVGGTTAAETAPADMITLKLSEDAYEGNAMFVLYIDGKAVTAPQVVTALHDAGQTQSFTFTGSLGSGTHTLGVGFTNDAYAGTPETDRNLYIDGIALNGAQVFNGVKALDTDGISSFVVSTTH